MFFVMTAVAGGAGQSSLSIAGMSCFSSAGGSRDNLMTFSLSSDRSTDLARSLTTTTREGERSRSYIPESIGQAN